MHKLALISMMSLAIAAPAIASSPLRPVPAVFVERAGAPGNAARIVEPATTLARGDRVILVLDWEAPANGREFTVTSAVPSPLAFQRGNGTEEVSVDGGRSWGRLGALRIAGRNMQRIATPEDVTHLRWHIASQATRRGHGRVTYSAIVR